jgi:uncharacterized protein YndB with AHSA1/START domain
MKRQRSFHSEEKIIEFLTHVTQEEWAMALTARTSVVINKPVEAVWAYLNDHSNEPEWRRPSLKTLEQVGSGPTGVGTRYKGVIAVGPIKAPYVNELTAFEPPYRVAWKAISSAGWLIGSSGSYTLEDENGRTRFTHEITVEPNNFGGRLVMPLVGASGSSMIMPLAKQLKQALEKQPG